eukprot:m.29078 g.29078  ORF g.29078 m.29078 type:complete len:692 (+) comp16037_c0_seq1:36-2111(+)
MMSMFNTKMIAGLSMMVAMTEATKPHVVMAVVDDLGWNDVEWHDSFGQIKTPKLTEMVKTESIELDNYYVYRFCSPTRSTFMTGRYPWHIGQQTDMNLNPTPGIACGINLKYDFLPKVLKPQGYTTWALGKWHLGFLTNQFTPTYRGFDHYLGYYSGAEEHFTHLKEGEGFNCYDLANNTGDMIGPCLDAVGNASGTYSSYLYGNETLRMLDNHDAATPLFIYLAWNNVHSPCEAPDNYLAVNSHIQDKSRQALAGMMSALDDQLTDVILRFKSKGMWNNTFFIFTTDNGGNLGGSGCNYPLRGGKYTFWQGGVRGNSFVSGGLVPAARRGTRWSGMAHAADWYTTIAAMASADTTNSGPLPPDGVNLFEAIMTNATSPRTEVVIQIRSNSSKNKYASLTPEFCSSNPEEPHCYPPLHSTNHYQTPQTTPRPFPVVAACNVSDDGQVWEYNKLFNGSLCQKSSSGTCFNVQKSADEIILFPTGNSATGNNEVFTFKNGMLVSAMGSCVAASTDGSQLALATCGDVDTTGFSFDVTTNQIKVSNTKTTGCVSAVPVADGPTGLETGVLIQGQYKLIMGYPGWSNQNWNGWIQPPSLSDKYSFEANARVNESFCTPVPCLFDIDVDPTEHNDIYTQHPDIVATMSARILELLKGEVTMQDSDLCPTSIGSAVDRRSLASAKALGFWVPWLAPI